MITGLDALNILADVELTIPFSPLCCKLHQGIPH
jgi:hypothetical protein